MLFLVLCTQISYCTRKYSNEMSILVYLFQDTINFVEKLVKCESRFRNVSSVHKVIIPKCRACHRRSWLRRGPWRNQVAPPSCRAIRHAHARFERVSGHIIFFDLSYFVNPPKMPFISLLVSQFPETPWTNFYILSIVGAIVIKSYLYQLTYWKKLKKIIRGTWGIRGRGSSRISQSHVGKRRGGGVLANIT